MPLNSVNVNLTNNNLTSIDSISDDSASKMVANKTGDHIIIDRSSSIEQLTEIVQILVKNANDWLEQHQLEDNFALITVDATLQLKKLDEDKLGAISVDFVSGALAHRRRFGGGRGEAVAKAIGIKGDYLPHVIDATAGLGRDAFVLAALGCKVMMFERHPVVVALLADGLVRAYADPKDGNWLQSNLSLMFTSSLSELVSYTEQPDVIYLDPMFPHRQKSALVKKEMRIFQSLVGSDDDADALLRPARALAKKRIVVKRPDYASYLNNEQPTASIKTKSHRFDIYSPLNKAK